MNTKKQQAEFKKEATKYLLSINAEAIESQSTFDWYKVDTICGWLKIGLEQPERGEIFSIYGRFEDENKAKEFLPHKMEDRLNPYSGKWNWHSRDAESMLRHFDIELSPLLLTVPA